MQILNIAQTSRGRQHGHDKDHENDDPLDHMHSQAQNEIALDFQEEITKMMIL